MYTNKIIVRLFMKKILHLSGFILLLSLIAPLSCFAADLPVWELGARAGYSFETKDHHAQQYDLFLRRELPLSWNISDNYRVGSRVEASAGTLTTPEATGFVGSLGPDVYLEVVGIVRIHGGTRLSLITEQRFGNKNLGGPVQFTTHGGVSVNVGSRFTVGYRFQHMSNAHFYDSNPGINSNMLEVGFRF
jgi:hypothetical protein